MKQLPIRGVLFSLMVLFALVLSACPGDETPTPAVAEPEGVLVVPEETPVLEPTPEVEPVVTPEVDPAVTPEVDPAVEPTPEVTPEVVTEPDVVAIGVADADGAMMLGSNLIGQDILNAQGENFGNIDDLLVNAADGHIHYALIQHGGFLTIGADVVPVPLQALTWSPQQEAFFLNIDEQQLEALPDVGDDWPEAMDPQRDAQIVEFWRGVGIDPYWERDPAQPTDNEVVDDEAVIHMIRASTLMDQELGGQWADRGTVDDLVVDLSESRIRYVLVEIDDNYSAIPYTAFNVTLIDDQIVLEPTAEAEQIEMIPVINREFFDEPTVLQRGWDDDLDTFWRDEGIDTTSPYAHLGEPAPAVAATPAPHVGVAEVEEDLMILASRLLGQDVESADRETVGSIDDFIMDINTGNVLFVLIRHGGFLGIGTDTVPVPLQALSVAPDFDNLVLDVTEAEFETWPDVDVDDTWPVGLEPGWHEQVGGFWQTAGYDVRALQEVAPGAAVRGSHLVGFGVGAPAGAAPGTVGTPAATTNDLIVDLQDGQVKYAVLSFTDVAVWGEQWFIVPFEAFDPAAFTDQFIFQQTIEPEVLMEAPRVQAAALTEAEFLSPRWDDELRAYWEERGFQFN